MASKQGNRNAFRHGLYAREAVLPWEDEHAFGALHRSFIDELNPQGPLEEEAVREIAELHWRKQRLALGYLLPFYRDMPPVELTEAAKQGLVALAKYLADSAHRSPGTIVATSMQLLDYIKGRAIHEGGAVKPSKPTAVMQPANASLRNVVELAYDPASFELRLKIETAIDNRIAKTMGRLVGLKEYKRMYAQTPARITAPPLVPPERVPDTVEATPPAELASIKKRQWGDPD